MINEEMIVNAHCEPNLGCVALSPMTWPYNLMMHNLYILCHLMVPNRGKI